MSYANPDTLMEVANILESFDEENLCEIFKSQILLSDDLTALKINHLTPLYVSYQKVMNTPGVDEDAVAEVKSKFQSVCSSIIQFICAKFNLSMDINWIESNYGKLPAIAMCMYQFFVLDIFYIYLKALNNYISLNIDDLFNAFSDNMQEKDVTTITNMKIMDSKYATIISSMYDVTDYAFTMMDNDMILEYIGSKYAPGAILAKMLDAGSLTGDFANVFANLYKQDLALRSKITFELIYRIKEQGYLSCKFNPLIIPKSQLIKTESSEDTYHKNTDISDDVD